MDLASMTPPIVKQRLCPQVGITAAEYAILIGLLIVVAAGGVAVLGGSVKELLANAGNKAKANNTLSLLNSTSAAGGGNASASSSTGNGTAVLKGGGYYALSIDPATGQNEIKLVDGSSGVAVNVSSVEGTDRYNALGTMMLAKKLDSMAEAQTDPAAKAYFQEVAKYAYYLGGTEGVMDNLDYVSGGDIMVSQPDPKTGKLVGYTLGNGLQDTYSYQQKLQGLLTNPPANVNIQNLAEMMPYAVDVVNIGQNYLNNYANFIGSDGRVPKNFGDPAQCNPNPPYGCGAGQGPGASLASADAVSTTAPNMHEMVQMTYDQLVDFSSIKSKADQVLTAYDVSNTPVVATFTDAKTVDKQTQNQ